MKKTLVPAMLLVLGLTLSACGSEEVKVIESAGGQSAAAQTEETKTEETAAATEEVQAEGTQAALSGYTYNATYGEGSVTIGMDMDMRPVLEALGEPSSYFEAASCAFQGLDKIYTYDHFEVDTYPSGDQDLVSSVVLLDDLVTTSEGLYIGQTKADMEALYGTEYEDKGGSCVYTLDGMHLEIVLDGDTISSIAYNSSVLDQ
ncbi:MAG: hypothetical protein K5682_09905 [Lachnospiraceae bacterium]|nr:hypothetical protein [Lachnospiraceae bacterium]